MKYFIALITFLFFLIWNIPFLVIMLFATLWNWSSKYFNAFKSKMIDMVDIFLGDINSNDY